MNMRGKSILSRGSNRGSRKLKFGIGCLVSVQLVLGLELGKDCGFGIMICFWSTGICQEMSLERQRRTL